MTGKSDNLNNLVKFENIQDVKEFLEGPTTAIAEFLTGALSHGPWPSEYSLTAGRVVQSAIKGRLFMQLGREIKKLRTEGRIKEDYFATHKNQATLLELLQFIDGDTPDDEVFRALKAIYFSSITIDADAKKEEIAYQLLQLCKKLNSMDILILRACYSIYCTPKHNYRNIGSYRDWANIVSEKIGYQLPELINIEDEKLVGLELLSGRHYGDKSAISKGENFRLTTLGIKLCELATAWDLETDVSNQKI